MNSDPTPNSMDSAARMFAAEIRRERRSSWAILIVFFLLLAIMFGYNLVAVNTVAGEQHREEFRSRGESAGALSRLRTQQNAAAIVQRAAEREKQESQTTENIQAFRRALRATSPGALFDDAEKYAIAHLYGRQLNTSTASVLVAALEANLSAKQAALLEAALLDWSMPAEMSDVALASALPKIERFTQILYSDPDYAPYGHAAMAGYLFRKANSGDMYMDWENGCRELVVEAEEALKVAADVARSLNDQEAAGLNMHYWRGQCRRRHAEPLEALKDFKAMMKVVGDDAFPPSNPYKFQAFHGLAMASMGLPAGSDGSEEKPMDADEAIALLEKAAQYRAASGYTDSGQVSSLGNVGILTVRKTTPEKYVQALEFTESVDNITASTWNLVGRLVATRAMLAPDAPPISDPALQAKYTKAALEDIAFDTLAKLAYLEPDFPRAEFEKLLDKEHHPVLDEIGKCIGKKLGCYETMDE